MRVTQLERFEKRVLVVAPRSRGRFRRCHKCKADVSREEMYGIKILGSRCYYWQYLCMQCASTMKNAAYDYWAHEVTNS